MTVHEIQQALVAKGYDPGPLDGVWGRSTIAAVKAFQTARLLQVDGFVGPETIARLFSRPPVVKETLPVWHLEAQRLMGTREIAGARSNPTILGWARAIGGWVAKSYRNDDTPWCGLFVAHCIGATLPDEPLPTNPLSALAWQTLGVPMSGPALGALCVFSRKGGGHVGFYVGSDRHSVTVIGGNQGNTVSVSSLSRDRLVAYRWPKTGQPPSGGAITRAAGPLSRNEA